MRIKRHDQASCAQVFGLLGLWVGKLNHSCGRRAAAYQILIKKILSEDSRADHDACRPAAESFAENRSICGEKRYPAQ